MIKGLRGRSHRSKAATKRYDAQDHVFRMDQASDSQQASEDHPSNDWTTQVQNRPCTELLTKALHKLPRLRELTLRPPGLYLKPKKTQEAALGQICGDLALTPCLRSQGK